ncbi:MAG: hypothetical protein LBN39_08035, partial [Planctomycetaceae bacterium]|nr:hypothetical protein [Planctomycetaceae bacterium]
GKLFGSEIHELLHQVDTLVTHNLGYPRGTTISPDAGRSEKSKRQDGDQEYKLGTWADYYKHIMQEHVTRQIWSELTIDPVAAENKPGRNVHIEE